MDQPDVWREVLAEAMRRAQVRRSGPILGTWLRTLLDQVAAERHLSFPPADFPDLRFGEFLARYQDVVTVVRQKPGDILVAPSSKPELLSGARASIAGIRPDIFAALTLVRTDRVAWYHRPSDSVEWRNLDDDPSGGGDYVCLPRATMEDALDVRRQFAETVSDSSHKESLLTTLAAAPGALSDFSKAVWSTRLQGSWHVFRMAELVRRLRAWADREGVGWSDGWLTAKSPHWRSALPQQTTQREPASRAVFEALAQRLEPADWARISIPLDLVVKALARD